MLLFTRRLPICLIFFLFKFLQVCSDLKILFAKMMGTLLSEGEAIKEGHGRGQRMEHDIGVDGTSIGKDLGLFP